MIGSQLDADEIAFVFSLARKAARNYQWSPLYEDLVSAGVEAAIVAAKSYDDTRPFKSYLSVRVPGAVIDELRRLTHRRRATPRPTDLSLEAIAEQVPGWELADTGRDPGEVASDVDPFEWLSVLPDRLCALMRFRYIDGESQEVVGARLGISNSRVCQLESRALRHLARVMEPA